MSAKQKQKQEIQTITILQDLLLMLFFQGVRRLFVLALNNTVNVPNNPINNTNNRVLRNSHTKYSPPRVNITNYNVVIDGRIFYDQPINDLVKQRLERLQQDMERITQQGKYHYNLIAVDLSKQMLIQEQFNKLSFMGC